MSKVSRRSFLKTSSHALTGYAAYSVLRPSGVAFASGGFCSNIPIVELHLSGEAPDHLLLCPSKGSAAWDSYAQNNPSILPTRPTTTGGPEQALLPITGYPEYAFRATMPAFQTAINNRDANKYSLAVVNYVGHSVNRDAGHDTSWQKVSSGDLSNLIVPTLGWAGKLADQCYADDPMAVFSLRGRTLTTEGVKSRTNVINDLSSLGFINPRGGVPMRLHLAETFKKLRKNDPYLANVSENAMQATWDAVDESVQRVGTITQKYNAIPSTQRAVYGTDGLSRQFLNAAQLIRAGDFTRGSIHLSFGGWDVHSNAAASIQNLTTTLNNAVQSFLTDMEFGSHDVILLIWHGFGRNSFQNQNTALDSAGRTIEVPGNDHGHGRCVSIFGRGSRIIPGVHGPTGYRPDDFFNPRLVSGALGWIPGGDVTMDRGKKVIGVDFREVLAQVLEQAGGDPTKIIPGTFPKSQYNIKLFKNA